MSGPGYPTLFLFEVGQWYDYAGLVLVVVCLAVAAWLAQRYKWFVIAFFIVIPVLLSIFWWPHSTEGTSSAGWFPMVKLYSALRGSLSLVALQYVPKLRHNKYYLLLPPLLLAVNITEAVIRDFQCFSMTGVDPTQGFWCVGGPWNIMNGIAGILNILAISGWMGIYISRKKSKAIIWGDLTVWWIIAYDLWNFAYLYNCMSGHAWYNGFGLLLGCTIPAFMKWGRGAWIQYRAYTLYLWCAFTLTWPTFWTLPIEHRPSENTTALFVMSLLALLANVALVVYHFGRIVMHRKKVWKQEVYSDTASYLQLVKETASREDQQLIAGRLGMSADVLYGADVSPVEEKEGESRENDVY